MFLRAAKTGKVSVPKSESASVSVSVLAALPMVNSIYYLLYFFQKFPGTANVVYFVLCKTKKTTFFDFRQINLKFIPIKLNILNDILQEYNILDRTFALV